jgi:hypothetical protein
MTAFNATIVVLNAVIASMRLSHLKMSHFLIPRAKGQLPMKCSA